MTVTDLIAWKKRGHRFAMLTAYDYTTARILAEAGIPVLLIGDSLGMVVLGHATTLPVTMADMLRHTGAVVRGASGQLLVADMPFNSYQASDSDAIANAAALLQAGAHAVKLEGGGRVAALVGLLTERGIPVMGHLGLTPQSINRLGGMKVQGRDRAGGLALERDAQALEAAGAFAVVLEGIPRELAAVITGALAVPTIGIGAGPDCDGQVLVSHDLLGLTRGAVPKFVKPYADLGKLAIEAARRYAIDVEERRFPDDTHSYHRSPARTGDSPDSAGGDPMVGPMPERKPDRRVGADDGRTSPGTPQPGGAGSRRL